MRLATVLIGIVVAVLLGTVFVNERNPSPAADTVSSDAPVTPPTPVCIEQLDASGNVVESYMVARFVAVYGPRRMIDARADIDPSEVTGPAGMVAFETVDGRRLFLERPWRIP